MRKILAAIIGIVFTSIAFAADNATIAHVNPGSGTSQSLYNEGIALYNKGDFSGAAKKFEMALATADRRLEANAAYNLGNAKYKAGAAQKEQDPHSTVSLWEQSLEHYKRALAINPRDTDAKVNYEVVAKQVKELKANLPPQEKEEQNKQCPFGKDKKEDQSQNSGTKDSPQGMQQQRGAESGQDDAGRKPNEESGGADQKQPSGDEQRQESGVQPQASARNSQEQPADKDGTAGLQEDKGGMSRKEAGMLLDAYRQDEKAVGMIRDKGQGNVDEAQKDW